MRAVAAEVVEPVGRVVGHQKWLRGEADVAVEAFFAERDEVGIDDGPRSVQFRRELASHFPSSADVRRRLGLVDHDDAHVEGLPSKGDERVELERQILAEEDVVEVPYRAQLAHLRHGLHRDRPPSVRRPHPRRRDQRTLIKKVEVVVAVPSLRFGPAVDPVRGDPPTEQRIFRHPEVRVPKARGTPVEIRQRVRGGLRVRGSLRVRCCSRVVVLPSDDGLRRDAKFAKGQVSPPLRRPRDADARPLEEDRLFPPVAEAGVGFREEDELLAAAAPIRRRPDARPVVDAVEAIVVEHVRVPVVDASRRVGESDLPSLHRLCGHDCRRPIRCHARRRNNHLRFHAAFLRHSEDRRFSRVPSNEDHRPQDERKNTDAAPNNAITFFAPLAKESSFPEHRRVACCCCCWSRRKARRAY
mmetsp:Transcript_16415/g.53438  ORF Transcript_16415/g.53438 Transcript_16415/m.53438 type:complete len:414 (-) Transcript_16415:56-1297(-)